MFQRIVTIENVGQAAFLSLLVSLGFLGCSGDDIEDTSPTPGDNSSPSPGDDDTGDDDSGDDDSGDDDSGDDDSGDDDSGDDDSGDDDMGDDDSGDDDVSPSAASSVVSLNQSPPAEESAVSVEGVVTAISYNGSFWIADPEGGLYSGIYVYDSSGESYADGLNVDDVVLISGTFQTYYGVHEIVLSSGSSSVEVVGSGSVEPMMLSSLGVLQPDAICQMDEADPDLQPYIGVLMTLPTSSVAAGLGACGTNESYGIWEVEDDEGNLVLIDDDAGGAFDAAVGDSVDITGIFHFSYSQHKVMALPNDDGSGGDDDDDSTPAPLLSTDIYTLNTDPPEEGTALEVSGIVTNIADDGDFWIEMADGGLYGGILVYDPDMKGLDAGIEVGDEVNVMGSFSVFYDLREVKVPGDETGSVVINEKAVGLPEPMSLDDLALFSSVDSLCETALVDDLDGYIGLLIETPEVSVASTEPCADHADQGLWLVEDSDGNALIVGQDTYSYSPTLDASLTLTGTVKYTWSEYRLMPLSINE